MNTTIVTTREARGRVPGDGVELAFGYWPGRDAPVVALHGLTATYLTFGGVAQRLRGRHPLFALDLRGRGDSGKPDGPYGFSQHARDAAAAMRAMGIGPSVILGHSMGAFVAAALAAQEPGLVSGLVLIDGGYVPDAPAGVAPDAGLNGALAKRIEQLKHTYPSREAYREHWREQPHFPASVWNPWIEDFLDYELGGETIFQPKASEAAVRADILDAINAEPLVERLKSIRVPTVMMRAGHGFTPGQPPLYPDTLATAIRECVPHIKDFKISEATHYTVVLGERGAEEIADRTCELADRSPARA